VCDLLFLFGGCATADDRRSTAEQRGHARAQARVGEARLESRTLQYNLCPGQRQTPPHVPRPAGRRGAADRVLVAALGRVSQVDSLKRDTHILDVVPDNVDHLQVLAARKVRKNITYTQRAGEGGWACLPHGGKAVGGRGERRSQQGETRKGSGLRGHKGARGTNLARRAHLVAR